MPRRRPIADLQTVLDLKALGHSDREVSARSGVPITTIRAWRNRGLPKYSAPRIDQPVDTCPVCGDEPHGVGSDSTEEYSYLLGVYLGDGYLARNGSSWTFRISLDAAYPAVIEECVKATEAVSGRRVYVRRDHGPACMEVSATWRRWLCLFPQHGPGRKHRRKIELADWQRKIVEAEPHLFLRGLVHTDGWRGLNRVRVKGRDYAYPRYQFSNRSDDIRKLFTDVCDMIGVEWRQWTRFHVSVARRSSVAILDSFIGPKT